MIQLLPIVSTIGTALRLPALVALRPRYLVGSSLRKHETSRLTWSF